MGLCQVLVQVLGAAGLVKVKGATACTARPLVCDDLAKEFIGASCFLLTYGDILVKQETYAQMIHRYNEDYFSGVITVTGSEDVTKGGLVFFDGKFCLTRLVEKPAPEDAPSNLAIIGRYVLTPKIFDKLEQTPRGSGGEIQLTDAIAELMEEQAVYGYEFEGVRYDAGTTMGWLKASVELALQRPELSTEFRAYLAGLQL